MDFYKIKMLDSYAISEELVPKYLELSPLLKNKEIQHSLWKSQHWNMTPLCTAQQISADLCVVTAQVS